MTGWAEHYRLAAERLLALQDAVPGGTPHGDLVRRALGEAATKYVLAMLEHQRQLLSRKGGNDDDL